MVSRESLRQGMSGHSAAERACVKVTGGQVSFSIECMKKAVPKGTNSGTWTAADRQAARGIYTE